MVPHISFLHALAVGACVTPTDPILSNSIVKGQFADRHIPKPLQRIIIAESGANDGLGYPFLFIALYLIKYNGHDGFAGVGHAVGLWFDETWLYTIALSVLYGAVVGWLAQKLLHLAEDRNFVDRESFLVFAITIGLFVVGTGGLLGTDDVLACFVAGNAFTWDDWFRKETEDDSLQPTIDMLLNITVFMWYGAIAPWVSFRVNEVIPLWRLIVLGILILVFRRIPFILAVHKGISEIEHWRQALFTGFFGPIGVSAVFYLYIAVEYLDTIRVDGEVRSDAARLQEVMRVVVWFLAITSVVVHGKHVSKYFGHCYMLTVVRFECVGRDPGIQCSTTDIEVTQLPTHPFAGSIGRFSSPCRANPTADTCSRSSERSAPAVHHHHWPA